MSHLFCHLYGGLSQHGWHKSVYLKLRGNGGTQSSSSAYFFPGHRGHVTAAWGGRCGLNFPGVSLSPNRSTCSVSKEEHHLPFFLCLPAIISVCNFLCFTFCRSSCREMFLQASLFYVFDLSYNNSLKYVDIFVSLRLSVCEKRGKCLVNSGSAALDLF